MQTVRSIWGCLQGTLIEGLLLQVEECAYGVILGLYRLELHLEGQTEGVGLVFG